MTSEHAQNFHHQHWRRRTAEVHAAEVGEGTVPRGEVGFAVRVEHWDPAVIDADSEGGSVAAGVAELQGLPGDALSETSLELVPDVVDADRAVVASCPSSFVTHMGGGLEGQHGEPHGAD
ncbi:MAG: hypothetical protein M3527_07945, partial [Actinomycetota bacterium]|nr:hypothetical protein [Actinomycetota bacterium]